jgi:predicted anti-sigma-YlaC factor YlaD
MESCDRYREAISARLDREDPGVPVDRIQAHLVSCADCRSWADAVGVLDAYQVVVDRPALRPAALNGLLDGGTGQPRRRLTAGAWRVALVLVAASQLAVTWYELLADDGPAPAHAARELASWDLGLAVGFLVLAWMPWRAWGALPVVGVMVVLLAGTAVGDLLADRAELAHEAAHLLQVAGLLCLWVIARRTPRPPEVIIKLP